MKIGFENGRFLLYDEWYILKKLLEKERWKLCTQKI